MIFAIRVKNAVLFKSAMQSGNIYLEELQTKMFSIDKRNAKAGKIEI